MIIAEVTQYNFTTLHVKHDGVPVADCLSWNVQVESTLELAKVIQTGWPDQRAGIDLDLHTFWIHHWNLSIVDGVMMNGTRIV